MWSSKAITPLEENMGRNLHEIGFGNFPLIFLNHDSLYINNIHVINFIY
jgi:hypothetical protein